MPAPQTTLGAIVLLLTAFSWQDVAPSGDHPRDTPAAESPRNVVARWLELHRTGKRDEASALTTASLYHRADDLLPSNRDTGVRVERFLGNERAAVVVTTSMQDARDGERVLLFWLVWGDGSWRIDKSDSFERRVVDERLRGFLEAGDMRWNVRPGELLGNWEVGPCSPPGVGGIACGSRLQFGDDNRYRLTAWGPGGPDPVHDYVMQGKWRVANGRILLSHHNRIHVCRIAWMAENLLVIEPLDEKGDAKGHAAYERADAAQDGSDVAENADRNQGDR